MNKKCNFCGEIKPIEKFGKQSRNLDGLNNRCRDCYRDYRKQWYDNNRETHIKNTAKNTERKLKLIHDWLGEYLLTHPCVDCGNTDILVLEFDHINDDKEGDIGTLTRRVSLAKLQAEVAKCEVRCVNCHRKITNKRRRELDNG